MPAYRKCRQSSIPFPKADRKVEPALGDRSRAETETVPQTFIHMKFRGNAHRLERFDAPLHGAPARYSVALSHAHKGRRFPFRIIAAVPRVLHDDRRGLRGIVAAVFRRPASDRTEIAQPVSYIAFGRARTEPVPGKPIAFARHISEQIAAFAEVGA